MANVKLEKARKYAQLNVPNGYKFDASRYLYGFAHGDEYPAFVKVIAEDEEKMRIARVYFFKYYNGSAAIFREEFNWMKNGERCQIINNNGDYKDEKVEEFPQGVRFNVNLLFKYCV